MPPCRGRRFGVRFQPDLLKLFGCCFFASTIACAKNTPEAPNATPTPPGNVTGAERLGWTQTAADSRELSIFHYAIYIDGTRAELAGASCQPPASRSSGDFDCIAPLPAMSAGTHTLELITFIVDGNVIESPRSAPLLVNRQ